MVQSNFINATVVAKRVLTTESVEVSFKVEDGSALEYEAGQYITLECEIEGQGVQRCYSLASTPKTDKTLKIGLKRIRGGVMSNFIVDNLGLNAIVKLKQARGKFTAKNNYDEYIFFAGGSGITPIYSILKTILPEGKRAKLYYYNKRELHTMYKTEIDGLAKTYGSHFQVYYNNTEEGGRRIGFENTYDLVRKEESKFSTQYFICGPEGMMDNVKAGLEYADVPEAAITLEYFNVSSSITDLVFQDRATYEVDVYVKDKITKLEIAAGDSVLKAILDAKLELPYSCENGVCGSCIAKIRSGDFMMAETDGITETEKADGYCLTCITYPTGNKLKLEL